MASSFIADLIGETETAISAADETARVNRERAYDPTILDPVARGKSDDATFVAHRLRAGLARLQELHSAAQERERSDQWHRDADAMEQIVLQFHDELLPMAKRAEAAELEYDLACRAIDNISSKIFVYMRRCDAIETAAPPGEARRLPRPIAGLVLSKFMKKVEPPTKVEPVVDYSLAYRPWKSADAPMTHEEMVKADEDRKAAEQLWLHNIHQAREDARIRIQGEIMARQRAAQQERRDFDNGL